MADIQEILNKNDIKHLTDTMSVGFTGVNKRLDKLNSQVAKNTHWRHYITGGLAVLSIMTVSIIISLIKDVLAK